MRVLVVCTMNLDRSPTAEAMLKKRRGLEVLSAGTDDYARVPLRADLIAWADVVVVMEEHHRQSIERRFGEEVAEKPLVVLGVPDDYRRGEQTLVEILDAQIEEHLDPVLAR